MKRNYIYIHIHTHIYTYLYIYMYVFFMSLEKEYYFAAYSGLVCIKYLRVKLNTFIFLPHPPEYRDYTHEPLGSTQE